MLQKPLLKDLYSLNSPVLLILVAYYRVRVVKENILRVSKVMMVKKMK